MPLRDFRCATCAAVSERLVPADKPGREAPVEPCAACGASGAEGPARTTEPASTSFVLQGSGWASDGYR